MALSRVQATGKVIADSATSVGITFATPPTVGNGVVVPLTLYNLSPDPPTSCVDNHGNTYTLAIFQPDTPDQVAIYFCAKITASGGPFTITVTKGTAGYFVASAIEVGGIGLWGLTLNRTAATSSLGSTTPATGSTAALTVAEAFLVAVCATSSSEPSITVETVSPTWTEEHEELSFVHAVGEGNTRIVTGALGTTVSCSWTWPTSAQWSAAIAAFAAADSPPGMTVDALHTDGTRMTVSSSYTGPTNVGLRVLLPPSPAAVPNRLLVILPVKPGTNTDFGDGLTEVVASGLHNTYNLTCVCPDTFYEPWWADHPTDGDQKLDTYLTADLIPWVRANITGAATSKVWLLSFSKGGWSVLSLLTKYPTVFQVGAAWDPPVTKVPSITDQVTFQGGWGAITFGTETNYDDNYDLLSHLAARKGPFTANARIWLSGDDSAYETDALAMHDALVAESVPHTWVTGTARAHHWNSGWVPGAVNGLATLAAALPPDAPPEIDLTVSDGVTVLDVPRLPLPPLAALAAETVGVTEYRARVPTTSLLLVEAAEYIKVLDPRLVALYAVRWQGEGTQPTPVPGIADDYWKTGV